MAPGTVACQAPLSTGFSRREYWSGYPFPSPGDLPDPGMEPGSSALQADSLPSEPPGKPEIQLKNLFCLNLIRRSCLRSAGLKYEHIVYALYLFSKF